MIRYANATHDKLSTDVLAGKYSSLNSKPSPPDKGSLIKVLYHAIGTAGNGAPVRVQNIKQLKKRLVSGCENLSKVQVMDLSWDLAIRDDLTLPTNCQAPPP